MDLNLITFMYLFLHLAPFILVCFFTLSSIFNQDFKGLILLIGLLIACFFNIMVGKFQLDFFKYERMIKPTNVSADSNVTYSSDLCSAMSIFNNGPDNSYNLPMGQTVYGYIFAYLLYAILLPEPNLVSQNIPTLVFFPVLISFDLWWNTNNRCNSILQLLVALIIGGGIGIGWAALIGLTKTDALKYFPALKNEEVCSKPAKQMFKCRIAGKKI